MNSGGFINLPKSEIFVMFCVQRKQSKAKLLGDLERPFGSFDTYQKQSFWRLEIPLEFRKLFKPPIIPLMNGKENWWDTT